MKKYSKRQDGFGTTGIIIAIVIMVVAALAVFYALRMQKEGPIKIGAVLSISGIAQNAGKEVRDAMLLAVDEINSRGGINGREIELIIEDSKSNPQEGRKTFNRIETEHHPLLYVSTLSSVSMALAPLAEENRVVLVGLVAATPKLTEKTQWVFRYYPTAKHEVEPILSILQTNKVKNLGIIYLRDAYGTSVFSLFKKEFERTGGKVRSAHFDVQEVDYKEQIAKLKDMEAIYAVGFDPHVKNAFKQLREAKFQGFILGSNSAAGPIVKNTPEANGAYLAAPIVYNPNFLFAKEIKEKYESKYGSPFTHFAANGYDFVKLLEGLLEDKAISRKAVKTILDQGFIYSGVFGSIEVKPGEHEIGFPLHPARIVDGKIDYLR